MKIIEKKEIKGAVKIVAFFVVLAIVLQVLSMAVFTKGDAATYNNKYANAYSYMLEPENTIQVAAFGNSDLYSAIAPTVVWQTSGIATTDIASPLQSIRQSYLMLEQFLEKQTPQVVTIEIDMLYKDPPDRERDYERDDGERFLDTVFDLADTDRTDDFVKSKFSIFVFHDKWKAFFKPQKTAQRELMSHGYHLSLNVKSFKLEDFMKKSDNLDMMTHVQESGLIDVIELCKSKNIEVLLMEVPSMNSWSYERHNAMQAFADAQGVKFLDFNMLWDELGISEKTDFRDRGNHMNYFGAEKASAYYGKYLAREFGIEDQRGNPDYAYWDKSVEDFQKVLETVAKEKKEAEAKAAAEEKKQNKK